MVAEECVHTVDNCHTFALTPRSPYPWWASNTLVCGLDEQVSSRLGDSLALLRAILREHILLPLGLNTLNMSRCKIFCIIDLRSCYTLRT